MRLPRVSVLGRHYQDTSGTQCRFSTLASQAATDCAATVFFRLRLVGQAEIAGLEIVFHAGSAEPHGHVRGPAKRAACNHRSPFDAIRVSGEFNVANGDQLAAKDMQISSKIHPSERQELGTAPIRATVILPDHQSAG